MTLRISHRGGEGEGEEGEGEEGGERGGRDDDEEDGGDVTCLDLCFDCVMSDVFHSFFLPFYSLKVN